MTNEKPQPRECDACGIDSGAIWSAYEEGEEKYATCNGCRPIYIPAAVDIQAAMKHAGYSAEFVDVGAGWCVEIRHDDTPGRFIWLCPWDGPYGRVHGEQFTPYGRFMVTNNTDDTQDEQHFWNAEGKAYDSTECYGADIQTTIDRAWTADLEPIN